jgi:hypothetical protein
MSCVLAFVFYVLVLSSPRIDIISSVSWQVNFSSIPSISNGFVLVGSLFYAAFSATTLHSVDNKVISE